MRRLVLVAGALLLGAAGCSEASGERSPGLTGSPAASAAAKPKEPAIDDCWTTTAYQASDALAFDFTSPADCGADHQLETVHVGQVTGAPAASAEVPARTELAALYPECERGAESYLGAAWQTGQVYLYLHAPTADEWRAGARHFRRDAATIASHAGRLVPVTETLNDSLRPGGPRTLGCAKKVAADKTITDLAPVPCTEPHDAEFVGVAKRADVGPPPADYDAFDKLFSPECNRQVLAYTGMSGSHAARQRVTAIPFTTSSKTGWESGDHSARCYLSLSKPTTRSLKAVGNITI